MAFSVVQVGDELRMLNESGEYSSALTLPTGITLRTDIPPRWHLFDRFAILVNTPDQPLIIDGEGTVRLLTPRAPGVAPTLAGPNAGSLSGTYAAARYTFVVLDGDGNIISESDYSPPSNSVTISSKKLQASGLETSVDDISARRIYRPTSGGATLFQWIDLDGNVLTSIEDDLADAALSLVAASPNLGTPPYLSLISSFRGRLFGAGPEDLDHVRYSEAGVRYAWPAENVIEIPVKGSDDIGITAFLSRREMLGVGRINSLTKITGTGAENSSGAPDFDAVSEAKECGILSQESVDVYRDTGFFLWYDGVYKWNDEGVVCVSDGTADGLGNVRSWFATDDYFDRSKFDQAFGYIDPIRHKYRLFLLDPDGAMKWVEYDIKNGTWWGPHKTNAFTPKSAFIVQVGKQRLPMIGATNTHVYKEQVARTDSTATAIPFDVIGKRHDNQEPDLDKYFGQLTLVGKAQTAGFLVVVSKVGELDASATAPQTRTQYYDMRKTRHQLGRLGTGKHLQLQFTHQVAGQLVEIYGYEDNDVHVVGSR